MEGSDERAKNAGIVDATTTRGSSDSMHRVAPSMTRENPGNAAPPFEPKGAADPLAEFKWGGDGCCIFRKSGVITCVKDKYLASSLRDEHNALIEAAVMQFIQAARKQRKALESGGWGHSLICNQCQGPDRCNCGVNDMMKALKDHESLRNCTPPKP